MNFCKNHWQSNQQYNWSVMASSITQPGRAKFTKFCLISFTHSCKLCVICWTGTFYPLPDYVIGIKRNRFFLKTYFFKKWIDLDSMGDFNFFYEPRENCGYSIMNTILKHSPSQSTVPAVPAKWSLHAWSINELHS